LAGIGDEAKLIEIDRLLATAQSSSVEHKEDSDTPAGHYL